MDSVFEAKNTSDGILITCKDFVCFRSTFPTERGKTNGSCSLCGEKYKSSYLRVGWHLTAISCSEAGAALAEKLLMSFKLPHCFSGGCVHPLRIIDVISQEKLAICYMMHVSASWSCWMNQSVKYVGGKMHRIYMDIYLVCIVSEGHLTTCYTAIQDYGLTDKAKVRFYFPHSFSSMTRTILCRRCRTYATA